MEKSSFFNAVETNGTYDRVYKAEDFADYFNKFIGNGIFYKKSDYCQITATGNDMNISESIGSAYINGYEYSNTTALTKAITVADGVLDRIDLVVLRLDYVNREIKLYIKESAFASTPVCPSLQRDADAYELGLASIYVKHGVTAISQADITDLRLNSDYCGVVHGVVEQIDLSALNSQANAEAKLEMKAFKKQFADFLNNLTEQMSGNVALNLQNQINQNKSAINEKANSIDLVDIAIEIENLKNGQITGCNSGIYVETLQNADRVIIAKGTYDSSKKEIKLTDDIYIKSFGFSFN